MDGHASAVVVIDLSCRIDSCTETPNDPVDEEFFVLSGSFRPKTEAHVNLGFGREGVLNPIVN
jgi:hypothetical protein